MNYDITDAWVQDAELRGWRDLREAPISLPEHWAARWREHADPDAPFALVVELPAPDGHVWRKYLWVSRELLLEPVGRQALTDQLEHEYRVAQSAWCDVNEVPGEASGQESEEVA